LFLGIGEILFGFKQKIKDAYFAVEDKYYALLDAINEKIPIYKIIDPIDSVFPSMILWIVLLVGLTVMFFFLQAPLLGTIKVLDSEKNTAISGATLTINIDGKDLLLSTNDSGIANIELGANEKSVNASVKKKEYAGWSGQLLLKANSITEIKLLKAIARFEAKIKIVAIDADSGEKIAGKKVAASFSCSTQSAAPANAETENGELETTYAESCGTMYASVSAQGYGKKTNQALSAKPEDQPNQIRLSPLDTAGKINVQVEDSQGNAVGNTRVFLSDEDGAERDASVTDDSGTVQFRNVRPGTYTVRAVHEDGRANEKSIGLGPADTVDVRITLEDLVNAKKILIKLVDSETKEAINDAEIAIYLETGFFSGGRTGIDGLFEANADERSYFAVASHPSYVSKVFRVELKNPADTNEQTIELEKARIDASNFSMANVFVTDYDTQKPVGDAEVLLYNSDYNWIPMVRPSKLSNSDGNTVFANLPAGTYFARAKKDNSEGMSIAKPIALGQTENFNVVLVLGSGDFELTAMDQNGFALKDANVWFVDAANGTTLDYGTTDAAGKIGSAQIKSDRVVYFKVRKAGYLNYKSMQRQVVPDATQKVEVRMIDLASVANERDLAIKFKGFYKDASLLASKKETILQSGTNGTKYFLRFEVILPRSATYAETKKHFRVGKNAQATLPDTNYLIKATDAEASPNSSATLSKCFDAGNIYSNPGNCNDTSKGAKQANIAWQDVEAQSVFEEVVTAFIEPGLKKGTEVRFYYRGKTKINNTDFETEEFVKVFKVGERVCESDCPPFLWSFLLQKNSTMEELDNFQKNREKRLQLNADYNLLFAVINTRDVDYDANISIENKNPAEVILFPGLGTGAGQKSLARFGFTGFTETSNGSPVKMRTAKEAKFTEIELKANTLPAVSDNNISLFFSVFADGNLAATGLQKNLDPRIPNQKLSGKLIDENSLLQISNAVFRIFKDFSQQPVFFGFTNATGDFNYTVETAATNQVAIEFEKSGYNILRVIIPVIDSSYNPNFECITVDKNQLALNLKETKKARIITTGCSEQVEIKIASELQASAETTILGKNADTNISITADKKTPTASEIAIGEYAVFIKARFASDIEFANARKITLLVSDPNSCFTISKTTFSFANQNKEQALIKNICPTTTKNVFRPKLEIDSEKVSVGFNPFEIPENISFNWNAKITGSERYLESQDVNVTGQNWRQTAIETGPANATADFSGTVTTQITDANQATTARFVSLLLGQCVGDPEITTASLGIIADTRISITTSAGTTEMNIPCGANGCNWEENTCRTRAEECYGVVSRCQLSYIEFNLDQTQTVNSITAKVSNPENASLLMYDIFATRAINAPAPTKTQTVEARGSTHASTIGTEEGRAYYLGELDVLLSNLENSLDYKQGYFRDANVEIENDSNGQVESWVQGTAVFARYLGKPKELNGDINFSLNNISIDNSEYAIITVQDYTNKKR